MLCRRRHHSYGECYRYENNGKPEPASHIISKYCRLQNLQSCINFNADSYILTVTTCPSTLTLAQTGQPVTMPQMKMIGAARY